MTLLDVEWGLSCNKQFPGVRRPRKMWTRDDMNTLCQLNPHTNLRLPRIPTQAQRGLGLEEEEEEEEEEVGYQEEQEQEQKQEGAAAFLKTRAHSRN